MKLKKIFIPIVIILIIIILMVSINKLNSNNSSISKINDIIETIDINESKLEVRYIKGNMIDESIQYGNILTKIIEVTNNTTNDLAYAIRFNESSISNNNLTYYISESTSLDDNSFINLTDEEYLTETNSLGYNLISPSKSTKYIKIVFKANNEESDTELKGILNITSNLSEKDIFISNINHIITSLNSKIDELNGINESGIYITNINESNYSGYILIDATDISDLKYYLTIYNDKLMVVNINYDTLTKSNITSIDTNETNTLNEDIICNNYSSKKTCSNLNTVSYNPKGGRVVFMNLVKEIIDNVKEIELTSKEVYVLSVKEDINPNTDLEGYILINNKLDVPEYYLYVHNYLFMVSGYNYTKLGEFNSSSSTIRAYNVTAFNLTNTKNKVCTFSGFSNCIDKSNNLLTD
jgi:hypothetical protein